MGRSRLTFLMMVLLNLIVSCPAGATEKPDAGDGEGASSMSRPYRVPDDPTLSQPDHDSQVLGQDPRRQTIVNPAEQGLHPAHRQRSARAAKASLPALKDQLLQNAR